MFNNESEVDQYGSGISIECLTAHILFIAHLIVCVWHSNNGSAVIWVMFEKVAGLRVDGWQSVIARDALDAYRSQDWFIIQIGNFFGKERTDRFEKAAWKPNFRRWSAGNEYSISI